MHKAQGGKRTIKLNLDRVIGSTGERSAWPAASFERPRFLSDFAAVEVAQYNQSLCDRDPVCFRVVRQRAWRQRLRWRRRPVRGRRPVPDDRDDQQSGFRPGGKRRPGGQLRRHRDFHQRQTAVLHRQGLFEYTAFRLQPVAVHAPCRRAGRRRQRRRRHRRGQAQWRIWAGPNTACSPPTRPAKRGVPSMHCAWSGTSTSRTRA